MKLITKSIILIGLVLSTVTAMAESLKLGHYVSPSDFRGQTAQKFVDFLAEKKNDKLTVAVYPNESLVKGRDALQATSRGTVDLYSVFVGYITGSVNLMKVFTFPFPSASYTDQKLMEFANNPEVLEILDRALSKNNIKLLGFINSTGNTKVFFRKPLTSLNDFKGLKIRGVGGYSDLALEQLKSSIVFMSAAEQFLQLETGGVDAVVTTESSYINQDLANVAPFTLQDSIVRGPYALIMNKKKWNRLDEKSQQQLQEAVKQTIEWSNEHVDAENKRLKDALDQKSKGVYVLIEKEREEIAVIQQNAIKKFIEENGEDAEKLSTIYQKYQ